MPPLSSGYGITYGSVNEGLLQLSHLYIEDGVPTVTALMFKKAGTDTHIGTQSPWADVGDRFFATSASCTLDGKAVDVVQEGRVMEIVSVKDMFMCYSVTTPDQDEPIKFISVSIGFGHQKSLGVLGEKVLYDHLNYNGDYVQLSSFVMTDGGLETYAVDFTRTGEDGPQLPDMVGLRFECEECTYMDGYEDVVRSIVTVIGQNNDILLLMNDNDKRSAYWTATVSGNPNGDYGLTIHSNFTNESGEKGEGCYFGAISGLNSIRVAMVVPDPDHEETLVAVLHGIAIQPEM